MVKVLDFVSILNELQYSYHSVIIVRFHSNYIHCTIALKQFEVLYSWKFFPYTARTHRLLRGHMTSNDETVSRQNLWAGNIAKSMTSEGHSALLPANVDRQPLLQQGLMSFQLQFFQLYNKTLKDWSFGKQLVLFLSGPVIKGTQSADAHAH